MKKLTYCILFLAIFVSVPVFAEYKITLKNGREFIVEDYKEADGKIKFYKMGGLIEIDKNNIENINKVKAVKTTDEIPQPETVKSDVAEEPGKGPDIQSQKQAGMSRLKEIAKRKEEMGNEDKKIAEDRKRLDEDMKKEGRVTSFREKREFERRADELSDRIRKFNEELNRIDAEESQLINELKDIESRKKKQ